MQNPVLAVNASRSRERLPKDNKVSREEELERIRLENIKDRQDAQQRQENMYRNSTGNVLAQQQLSTNNNNFETKKKKQKKIQEDYSMYEEDEKGDEDDELEDIMEEDKEEESDSEGSPRQGGKKRKHKDNETNQ